jgi:DNA-binding XRE family transcriptional regulator
MTIGSLTIGGRRFVVVPEDEFKKLTTGTSASDDGLPPLPQPDSRGNVPAIAYARAGLARKLILGRRAAGWSQAELARRAGVRSETVNRIERGRNTPDMRTFAKLERALRKAGAPI